MKYSISRIRGTYDFSPREVVSFNKIAGRARKIFKLFGYQELKLPILEEESLFIRGVGSTTDIVEKQMFKVVREEEKETKIVLRPEGTVQVVRYYLENFLYKKSDFHKFFYIGAMFRGERPQRGRLRQFHHLGAEAIGSKSIYLDVETIALMIRILEEIGVKEKELKINSLGCLKDKEKLRYFLKNKLEEKKDRLCQDCQRRLKKNPLRVLDCKRETCKKEVEDLNIKEDYLCKDCLDNFKRILSLLDDLEINYIYTSALVRGLDYYTHTVFEVVSKKLGSQDALGAGGRYNHLIKDLGGPEIGAIGFALGIERILLVLEEKEKIRDTEVFVAAMPQFREDGFKLLQRLREENISSEIDYCDKSLKGQLRVAQKKKCRFVLILGEEEKKERVITLKDMQKSIQKKISERDLVKVLKDYLKAC